MPTHYPEKSYLTKEEDERYPSKSQRKRDMTALQKLGAQLVDSPADRIRKAAIADDLRDAILACQKINSHEGKRRQLQYVGKLMRKLDEAEVQAIRDMLDSWQGKSRADTLALHLLERQREMLLRDDKALTTLMQQYPGLAVQEWRTLIRNARREQAEARPPKAYRELFQQLKLLTQDQNTLSDTAEDGDDANN